MNDNNTNKLSMTVFTEPKKKITYQELFKNQKALETEQKEELRKLFKNLKDNRSKKDCDILFTNQIRDFANMFSECEKNKFKEINEYIAYVSKEYYYDLTSLDYICDNTCRDGMIDNILKKTYEKIPEHIKEMNSNEQYLNLIKIVQLTLFGLTKVDEQKVHRIMVWGTTGSGKTTLIKIMGSILNIFNPGVVTKTLFTDAHETATKEVTKNPQEVYIGCRKLELIDVPGTNDVNQACKEIDIINEIHSLNYTIDSMLYIVDISKARYTNEDLATLVNLAYGFKDIGIDLWEKVVIVFTKANVFNIYEKPEYDFDKKSDDYDKEYIQKYREWIIVENEELSKRISIRKKNFKESWFSLFSVFNMYENVSEEKKEECFNKIRFVVSGYVRNIKEDSYTNSCITPIPNRKVEGYLNKTDDGIELQNEIDNGDYILYENWLQDLLNAVVLTSSNEFKLHCHMANSNYLKDLEKNNENSRENATPPIQFKSETKKAINNGAHDHATEMNKNSPTGVMGYVLSGTAGGAVGALGVFTKVIIITTASATVGVLLFAAVGFAVGAGTYHIIYV